MLQAMKDALSLLPTKMSTQLALLLMLAIGYQESQGIHRRQLGNGPARGLWQFEKGGGVHGVMTHTASSGYAMQLCAHFRIPFNETAVYQALETNDVLAAGFARLLLWTAPGALPDNEADAWTYYERQWRPGKPRPHDWPNSYRAALADLA